MSDRLQTYMFAVFLFPGKSADSCADVARKQNKPHSRLADFFGLRSDACGSIEFGRAARGQFRIFFRPPCFPFPAPPKNRCTCRNLLRIQVLTIARVAGRKHIDFHRSPRECSALRFPFSAQPAQKKDRVAQSLFRPRKCRAFDFPTKKATGKTDCFFISPMHSPYSFRTSEIPIYL